MDIKCHLTTRDDVTAERALYNCFCLVSMNRFFSRFVNGFAITSKFSALSVRYYRARVSVGSGLIITQERNVGYS